MSQVASTGRLETPILAELRERIRPGTQHRRSRWRSWASGNPHQTWRLSFGLILREDKGNGNFFLHAWLSLKVKAKALGKTLYQTKDDLLSDYLRAELAAPRIQAFLPA